ncbi:MAG: helix-hairpin-helix domain-containing protein [Chloroflexota bacterium]
MDTEEKLALLGGAARYEIAGPGRDRQRRTGPAGALCAGDGPTGAAGTLLRVLQSNRCEHDCAYCPLRRSAPTPRAVLAPSELAGVFTELLRQGKVDGLMLSSAVDGGAEPAMARMLDTVQILRSHHQYEGYVHLKVLPGTDSATIAEAARLADRLSLNVEVPEARYLAGLETGKRWDDDILRPLAQLHALDQEGSVRAGLSSQMLVGLAGPDGAAPASDRALGAGSRMLRRDYGLRRVHYGLFQPAPGTPLAEASVPDPRRRARLYQWEWLAGSYDFSDDELDAAFDAAGRLPLALDPKLAVTLARPQDRPVEVNSASYEELLRVPGIGPVSARRIVDLRRLGGLRELADLRAMGVAAGRAAPFVLLNGSRPAEAGAALARLRKRLRSIEPRPVQLSFWPEFL